MGAPKTKKQQYLSLAISN